MKQTAVELLLRLRRIGLFSNRKTSAFLICLFLASSFWLLNALTKNYVISVPVPLKFENLSQDRIVVNELPRQLNFTFEGDGFSLIGLSESEDFDTKRVDIGNGRWSSSNKKVSGFISTQSVRDNITRKYSGQIKVLDVALDSILITTDQLAGKKLPVQLLLENLIPENKLLKQAPLIEPASIEVYGPSQQLEKLENYTIDSIPLEDKSGVQRFEVPVKMPNRLIKSPIEQLNLTIALEELTEAEVEIPITIVQSFDSLEIKTFPGKVKVKCSVGLSKFDQLSQNDFKAIVRSEDIEMRPARLNVYVESLNDKVIIQSVSPKRVEYIIRKL